MDRYRPLPLVVAGCVIMVAIAAACQAQSDVRLPRGVRAVWDVSKAYRETTATRERICINGLWRWQPVETKTDKVPEGGWGYFKVPGPWPGTSYWMHRESQTHYPHPSWRDEDLGQIDMAWYQRTFTVPREWGGRRISVYMEYLNSYAAVYVDGTNMGEVYFPGGDLEITSACRRGAQHVLSLYTVAMPLNAEIVSYADADGATRAKGRVLRRGLCGDVFLVSTPAAARIADVKVDTSVRQWEITFDAALHGLDPNPTYSLDARITDNGRSIKSFRSAPFTAADLKEGRFALTNAWKPDKLWDVHTPQNTYELQLSLRDSDGNVADTYQPVRFGFREFRIDGRDFRLNGIRFYCFAVPLDNAQIGTTAACYAGARESMSRLKRLGINTLYTHNYDCLPGSHLSFAEILRAADDVGMLVSLSQPHVKDYDWEAPDADTTNRYARHAEFYVRQAQNHPSVVMYSMNHNMTGYAQDMNPDWIDGIYNPFPDPTGKSDARTDGNARRAQRAEAIVRQLDSSRVIYHHSSGNHGQMYTSNFYLNFVPIQERSDWFEHWATKGVKPVLLCEYGVPLRMTWTLHRGWYKGQRSWTNGKIPHQFCSAEWGSQFLGDRSYDLTEPEREDLRFEAKQWRAGATWYRWDYPFQINNTPALGVANIDDLQAMYITDNWRAYRTWGVSAFNIWSLGNRWKLRDGVDKSRKTFDTDWDNLQRPGFSPDFIEDRYERIDTAYEFSDWIPTKNAKAFIRHNQPLLAYIAGKPARFTSKDHNFHAGEIVEKQIIIINNSRETVTCDCAWSLALPEAVSGRKKVTVPTGEQERIPLRFALPGTLAPGEYQLSMTAKFSSGEAQEDSLGVHVLPPAPDPTPQSKIAVFDPNGETAKRLTALGVAHQPVAADADLSPYSILVIGKAALTPDGPAPDVGRVRDGLKVLMFEQKADVLEQRLGFRVQEYGLRRVFPRIPDHPILDGLDTKHLRNWRGEARLLPARIYNDGDPSHYPSVWWCGIKVPRAWRAGCHGNVASVLIEKPACGDFLPILDGGFSLQYSPLMEYREGRGMILLCQMDVTGRTEDDPAATRLVSNMLRYVSAYSPAERRSAVYVGDPAGRAHLEHAGMSLGQHSVGALAPDQVLVVGPGGGRELTPHKEAIATWLKAGGHVLAIGLDGQEARAFLPFTVTTEAAEHICTYFEPPGMDWPLAGIGPADVLVRDPRQLPLVTAGAAVVGNGVLAVADDANVVFCQLVPWHFDYEELHNVKMTFRRASFLLARLLANMGAGGPTPLLSRFATPVGAAGARESLIRNGDFSVDTDGDGTADHWSISGDSRQMTAARERVAPGTDEWNQRLTCAGFGEKESGSLMLAQHGVPVQKGQWYRVSFAAKSESLRGARVTMTLMNTENWRSLFPYQRFAPREDWKQFTFLVQANDSADSRTRFQLWHGAIGTVWFSDVRMEPCNPPSQGRWLTGLYLDEPEEMDDPYRFFRW